MKIGRLVMVGVGTALVVEIGKGTRKGCNVGKFVMLKVGNIDSLTVNLVLHISVSVQLGIH